MILTAIEEFAAALPQYGAVLGLDFGQKTIGVAVSDVTRAIASPLLLIERKNRDADMAALMKAVASREAVGAVIGLPLQMDGSEGERAEITRKFAERLEAAWDSYNFV